MLLRLRGLGRILSIMLAQPCDPPPPFPPKLFGLSLELLFLQPSDQLGTDRIPDCAEDICK